MNQTEQEMREVLRESYNSDLLWLMFVQPYLKTDFLVRNNLVHRQTAAVYLKKMAEAASLVPKPIGRVTYYVNQRFIDLLAD